MTSKRLEEWFWEMFQPTPILPDFNFGQVVRWIGANNGQIRLSRGYKSDFEQCLNRLQLYLILIFDRYDFLEARRVILSHVRLQLALILILVNFVYELGQIMTRYDFQEAWRVILSNVRTNSNLTWFYFWSTFDMNWVKWWTYTSMSSWMLDLWFWVKFELILVNLWIWANNDKIWLLDEWFLAIFEPTSTWPNLILS